MTKNTEYKQGIITVVGTNYIDLIVPDFLEKCFNVYCKKNFDEKKFQVSVYENAYATAGIVLIALGIEAYRNMIFFHEKKEVKKENRVAKDISSLFKSYDSNFPESDFRDLIDELFILRDVIVHNHIYKVDIKFDGEWGMLSHRQKLLQGYGDDSKFKNLTSSRTKKTNNLRLNIQIGKIGYEDFLLVLIICDMFMGLSNEILKKRYIPHHFWKEIDGKHANNLNDYITYFFNKTPNEKYIKNLEKRLSSIRSNYDQFLGSAHDYFIGNICFACGKYGYRKLEKDWKCSKCGHGFVFASSKKELIRKLKEES